jgi:EmrB/QacA subfamily drug resistance transporter
MAKELVKRGRIKETKRSFVLVSIMLAMFMGAIEGTIVSTAMPAIVGDLGGFSLYSWVFSAYLLMNAITVLIYGKLSDIFGRKPVILFGITIFLLGSILCGLAQSMVMLIVFRFIQGFGAGAVTSIATTIVGDIYTKEERAKVQGYLSSVWGISAVLGPGFGGILVEFISWRFIFWLNIPLGLLSMLGLWLFLHEKISIKKHEIDYLGAMLLTVSVSTLMLVLVEGGTGWAWVSLPSLGILAFSIIVFNLFIFQEKRASEPIMPFSIWKERFILIANVTSLLTGIVLIGISSFLPAYIQGVMEYSPLVAGFALTTMSIGWPIASTVAGPLMLKMGYRNTSLFGGFVLVLGSIMFLTLTPEAGPLWAAIGSFLIGIGMGLTSTTFIVSIQNTVSWEKRGIATASNMFMRNFGNTVGAALLGGVLNSRMVSYFKENALVKGQLDAMNLLLDAEERSKLSETFRDFLQEALTFSLNTVYNVILLFAIISLIMIFFLPKVDNTSQ